MPYIEDGTPKISVIMSVYNGQRFLNKTINSILNQTFSDFEFIIINDGSTDNTLQILKKYKEKHKKIKILNNNKNLGLTKSLNKGLKIAKGEYIARMDDSDISLPKRFQTQFDFLEKHKDIFLVGVFEYNIDEKEKIRSFFKSSITPLEIKKTIFQKCPFHHNTIMFRNTGEYKYREKMIYGEDYDLYTRMHTDGKKLANIPQNLGKYRMLPDSISFKCRNKQLLFSKKVIEFLNQRVKTGKDDYDKFNPKDILKLPPIENKEILQDKIHLSFYFNQFKKSRKSILDYYKKYGFNLIKDREIHYYLPCTFLNKNSVDKIRNIVYFIRENIFKVNQI